MAIFPSDDPGLAVATRKRVRPLIAGYSSRYIESVRRNMATQGVSQSRDTWGKKKFYATVPFELAIADAELLMSFVDVYGISGFTGFDFEAKQIGSPGYRPAVNIGTGDGATTTFTIPAREVSGLIVWVAGVQKTAGVDYNLGTRSGALNDGPGAQGEDQVVFIAGHIPTAGQAITVAFLGRCRYTIELPEPATKETVDWNRQAIHMIWLEKWT